jgi:hypothetical protein
MSMKTLQLNDLRVLLVINYNKYRIKNYNSDFSVFKNSLFSFILSSSIFWSLVYQVNPSFGGLGFVNAFLIEFPAIELATTDQHDEINRLVMNLHRVNDCFIFFHDFKGVGH